MVYHDIRMPLPGFIALDFSLMTLAGVLVVIRLSLRRRDRQRSTSKSLSDAFVTGAWVLGLAYIGINAWKNTIRYRYRNWPSSELYYMVPHDQAGHLLKVSFFSLFLIYVSLWLSKGAFLAFYWSLFSLQSTKARIVLISASIFTFCTFLVHMLLLGLWCSPVWLNWNVDGDLCSAVHSIQSVTIMTFMNVSTDIVILFIPISTLAKIKLGKVELSGLFFILLMGSASIIAAISRFIVLELEKRVPRASITHTIDVLALVEIVTSIIAVCLPSLRTFVRGVQSRPSMSRSQSSFSCHNRENSNVSEKRTSGGSKRTTTDEIDTVHNAVAIQHQPTT